MQKFITATKEARKICKLVITDILRGLRLPAKSSTWLPAGARVRPTRRNGTDPPERANKTPGAPPPPFLPPTKSIPPRESFRFPHPSRSRSPPQLRARFAISIRLPQVLLPVPSPPIHAPRSGSFHSRRHGGGGGGGGGGGFGGGAAVAAADPDEAGALRHVLRVRRGPGRREARLRLRGAPLRALRRQGARPLAGRRAGRVLVPRPRRAPVPLLRRHGARRLRLHPLVHGRRRGLRRRVRSAAGAAGGGFEYDAAGGGAAPVPASSGDGHVLGLD